MLMIKNTQNVAPRIIMNARKLIGQRFHGSAHMYKLSVILKLLELTWERSSSCVLKYHHSLRKALRKSYGKRGLYSMINYCVQRFAARYVSLVKERKAVSLKKLGGWDTFKERTYARDQISRHRLKRMYRHNRPRAVLRTMSLLYREHLDHQCDALMWRRRRNHHAFEQSAFGNLPLNMMYWRYYLQLGSARIPLPHTLTLYCISCGRYRDRYANLHSLWHCLLEPDSDVLTDRNKPSTTEMLFKFRLLCESTPSIMDSCYQTKLCLTCATSQRRFHRSNADHKANKFSRSMADHTSFACLDSISELALRRSAEFNNHVAINHKIETISRCFVFDLLRTCHIYSPLDRQFSRLNKRL